MAHAKLAPLRVPGRSKVAGVFAPMRKLATEKSNFEKIDCDASVDPPR
jgi:hypothetical protein